MDGAIDLGRVIIAEIGDTSGDRARPGPRQIGPVGLLMEAHATGAED